MSADPSLPTDPSRYSGGHVIKNMIYKHQGNNQLEIVTGWTDQGSREYNQEIVPPAKIDMDSRHPCASLNRAVVECSLKCPDEMKLAGRTASCNDERKVLMQCLTKNKTWAPPAAGGGASDKPWYKLW